MANRVPNVGRIALTPMLNERGKLIGDFTMCRLCGRSLLPDRHLRGGVYYMRWFERHLPSERRLRAALRDGIHGPRSRGRKSRALLQGLVRDDLSTAAFPFMSFGAWKSAWCRAYVGRVSFTGEQGFEIWVTADYQRAFYDLADPGRSRAWLKAFGGRGLNAMRIEKSFRHVGARVPADLRPFEAGLGRFVDFKKDRFIGRAAASRSAMAAGPSSLIGFKVEATMRTPSAMSRYGMTAGRSAG
jgi:dimethylglycine dehydrogenase